MGPAIGNGKQYKRTEITNDKITVGVDEDVRGLQVTVHDTGRVHKLETLEHLIQEVLVVRITQFLTHADEAVEIALVAIEDEIQVVEICRAWGRCHDVTELNDVVVVGQVAKQFDLTQDTLGVHQVFENVRNLFDCHAVADDDVIRRADSAVGSTGNILEVLVPHVHFENIALANVHLVVLATACNVKLFRGKAGTAKPSAEWVSFARCSGARRSGCDRGAGSGRTAGLGSRRIGPLT